MKTKVVVFTGGVYSSVGKGLTLANVARIFKEIGFKVSVLKFDPYLNMDSGDLSPIQHGEVFVTFDGHETDLDLGHYERFLGRNVSRLSCITAGTIYKRVLDRKYIPEFSGETIQVIPHVGDTINGAIFDLLEKESDSDFLFIEIGGTVGDIESIPFIEAIRRFKNQYGSENFLLIHLSPLFYLSTSKEYKTKPIQHSLQRLSYFNLSADLLIIRSSTKPPSNIKSKVAISMQLQEKDIFFCLDHSNIYLIAESLFLEKIHERILEKLKIPISSGNIDSWKNHTKKILASKSKRIRVAIVGKYASLSDAYMSIIESLKISSYELGLDLILDCVSTEEQDIMKIIVSYDAICVAHGFGSRGVNEKINVIKYCRENNIPFLGICYGMQLAVIEYIRNVLGIKDANTEELDPETKNPVFVMFEDGKMRLGNKKIKIRKNTKAYELFGKEIIESRHRHKYFFNNKYIELFLNRDFVFSAVSDDSLEIAEIVEIKNHPFFMATQFHPEFETKFSNIPPLFTEFLKSGLKK